jgi:DNA-binding LacI/PurR family transcriptional regulator
VTRKKAAPKIETPALSPQRPVSLKTLAAYLNLSITTLSLVLNDSPQAASIPQETKDRVLAAARQFNYRPNFLARSLRAQRTHTLGVLVPELSEGYSAMVLGGVEEYLLQQGYFYFAASHHHRAELLEKYPQMLLDRSVEGLIVVDTPLLHPLACPVVAVSGHGEITGVTNIVLNHARAAALALDHLTQLGHWQIAIIKGQEFSSDTLVRWKAIRQHAKRLGLPLPPQLVAQLEEDSPSPEVGYHAAQKLLAARTPFTALFAFNDISALGAMRAFREAGLRVPEDISVIGFDDVPSAFFHNPALTTVRQPLHTMGQLAAETLLNRIAKGNDALYPKVLTVEPDLIVRQSTALAAPQQQLNQKSVRRRAR